MRLRAASFTFFLLLLAAALNTGCWNKDKYKKEIARLDSLDKILSGIIASSSAIDSLSLQGKIAQVEDDLKAADTLLPDTLKDRELAILLMDYRSVLNPLKQCPYKARDIQKEVKEMQKRIAALKSDLEKQIADEKQVNAYLETESKNAQVFNESMKTINEIKDNSVKKADSLSAFIKGKLQELTILKSEERKKKK
jgi:GTPase SAR1 family protein